MAKSNRKITVTVGVNVELGPELEAFIRSLGWVKKDEVPKAELVVDLSAPFPRDADVQRSAAMSRSMRAMI